MRLFDTHAHLDLPGCGTASERRFTVERAKSAGIRDILIPGIAPDTWSTLHNIAAQLRSEVPTVRIHTSVGIHPCWVGGLETCDKRAISTLLREAIASAPPGLVAIGECGLDFGARGRDVSRARQLEVLDAHVEVARATGLPLIVHCVRAHGLMLERLRRAPPSVLHSFSGGAELVQQYCRSGHFISFTGVITRPNARKSLAAVRAVPRDRLLIETDSPDQTPYPRRRDRAPHNAQIIRNEPAFLVDVAHAAARLRGLEPSSLAELTTSNALQMLGLDADADVRADDHAAQRDL